MLATIRPAADLLATPLDQLTDVDVADLLALARNRITDPDRWTRYTMARKSTGETCPSDSIDAYSFCAAGAIQSLSCQPRVHERLRGELRVRAAARMRTSYLGVSISDWNDAGATDHAEVLAGFDDAIARLRGDGPF